MTKKICIVMVLLYGLLLYLTTAIATTLIPMNHLELTTEAELIFVGTVADIESETKANNRIYTEVAFVDLTVVKGIHPGETLIVELAGGSIGDYHEMIVGMPEFQEGGKYLVFLRGNGIQLCPIVGWSQGKFNIIFNQVTGREEILDSDNNPIKEIKDNQIVRQAVSVEKKGEDEDFPGISLEHGIASTQLPPVDDGKRLTLQEFISATEKLLGLQ